MKLLVATATLAIVIPAQAGIQCPLATLLDSRLRGNDGGAVIVAPGFHRRRAARSPMDN
ncbi:MAG: hypothetical protein JSR53_11360 [Proteobacteria bacterium]|nr:hypothetical protein [Pseudomonadota bacterium]